MKLGEIFNDKQIELVKQYMPKFPLDVELTEQQEDDFEGDILVLMLSEFNEDYSALSEIGQEYERMLDIFVEA